MLDKIDTLEKARNYTFRNTGHTQGIHGTVALGQYCFNRKESDESKNAFEVFSYALEQCPAVRLVPWERIKPDINEGKCRGFGQLHHNSYQYLRYLHEGWTEKVRLITLSVVVQWIS